MTNMANEQKATKASEEHWYAYMIEVFQNEPG